MTVTSSAGPDTVVDPSALLTDGSQLIGGEWGPAAGGQTIDVINPATGELLLRVPRSGAADVDAARRASRRAW
jgi:acyl-CoA reductase-like NAD-dependent aldehyde dehydrogenase